MMYKIIATILFSLTLSACGGGGDDSSSSPIITKPPSGDTPVTATVPATVAVPVPTNLSVKLSNNSVAMTENATNIINLEVQTDAENYSVSVTKISGVEIFNVITSKTSVEIITSEANQDESAVFEVMVTAGDFVDTERFTVFAKDIPSEEFVISISNKDIQTVEGEWVTIPFDVNYLGTEDVKLNLKRKNNVGLSIDAFLSDKGNSTGTSSSIVSSASAKSASENDTGNIEIFTGDIDGEELTGYILEALVGNERYEVAVNITAQEEDEQTLSVSTTKSVLVFNESETQTTQVQLVGANEFSIEKVSGSELIVATKSHSSIEFSSLTTFNDIEAVYAISATNGDETKYANIEISIKTEDTPKLIIEVEEDNIALSDFTTYRLPVNIDYNKNDDISVSVTRLDGDDVIQAEYINEAVSFTTTQSEQNQQANFRIRVQAGEQVVESDVSSVYIANSEELSVTAAQKNITINESRGSSVPFVANGGDVTTWVESSQPGLVDAYLGNGLVFIDVNETEVDSVVTLTIWAEKDGVLARDNISVSVLDTTPRFINANIASNVTMNELTGAEIGFTYTANTREDVSVSVSTLSQEAAIDLTIVGTTLKLFANDVAENATNEYQLVLQADGVITLVPFTVKVTYVEEIYINMDVNQDTLSLNEGETGNVTFSYETNSEKNVNIEISKSGSELIDYELDGQTLTFGVINDISEIQNATFTIKISVEGNVSSQHINVRINPLSSLAVAEIEGVQMNENSDAIAMLSYTYEGSDDISIELLGVSSDAVVVTVDGVNLTFTASDVEEDIEVIVTLQVTAGDLLALVSFPVTVLDIFVPTLVLNPEANSIEFIEEQNGVINFTVDTNLDDITYQLSKIGGSGFLTATLEGQSVVATSVNLVQNRSATYRLTALSVKGGLSSSFDIEILATYKENTLDIIVGDVQIDINENSELNLPITVNYDGNRNILLSAASSSDEVNVSVVGNDTLRIIVDEVDADQSHIITVTGKNDEDELTIQIPLVIKEVFNASLTLNLNAPSISFVEDKQGILGFITQTNIEGEIPVVTVTNIGGDNIISEVRESEVIFTIGDITVNQSATFNVTATVKDMQVTKTVVVNANKRIYVLETTLSHESFDLVHGSSGDITVSVNYDGDDEPTIVAQSNNADINASVTGNIISVTTEDVSFDITGNVTVTVTTKENESELTFIVNATLLRVLDIALQDTLSMSASEIKLLPLNISYNGDEEISVTAISSNTNIATVAVDGESVSIISKATTDDADVVVEVTVAVGELIEKVSVIVSVKSSPSLIMSISENDTSFDEGTSSNVVVTAEHNHGNEVFITAVKTFGSDIIEFSINDNVISFTTPNIDKDEQAVFEVIATSGNLSKKELLTVTAIRVEGQLSLLLSSDAISFSETGVASVDIDAQYTQDSEITYAIARSLGEFDIIAEIVGNQAVFTSQNISENKSSTFTVTASTDGLSESADVTVTSERVDGLITLSLSKGSVSFEEQTVENIPVSVTNNQGDSVALNVVRLSGDPELTATLLGQTLVITSSDIISVNKQAVFEVSATSGAVVETAIVTATAEVMLGSINLTLSTSVVELDEGSTSIITVDATHSLPKAINISIEKSSGSSSIEASLLGSTILITLAELSQDVQATFTVKAEDGEVESSRQFTVSGNDTTVYIELSADNTSISMDENSSKDINLNSTLVNDTDGSATVSYDVEFSGEGSETYTGNVSDELLTITVADIDKVTKITAIVIATVGDESDSISVEIDPVNTSMIELEAQYAPIISGQVNAPEITYLLANLYSETAKLSLGFDESQAESFMDQYELNAQAVAISASDSAGVNFIQAVSNYQTGLSGESDVRSAFNTHLSALESVHQQVVEHLNVAATATGGLLPTLPVNSFIQTQEGDAYSMFVGHANIGQNVDGDFAFTGQFEILSRYIAINGIVQICTIESAE